MLFDLLFKLFLTKFQFSHNIDTPPLSRSKAYYLLVCAEVLRPVKVTSCAACEYMYCTMTLLNKSARKASLTFGNCVSLAGHRTLLCREKRPHCRPRSQSYLLLEADRTAPSPNAQLLAHSTHSGNGLWFPHDGRRHRTSIHGMNKDNRRSSQSCHPRLYQCQLLCHPCRLPSQLCHCLLSCHQLEFF